jgi:hypothetical protein
MVKVTILLEKKKKAKKVKYNFLIKIELLLEMALAARIIRSL